jgi:hypothetical protein
MITVRHKGIDSEYQNSLKIRERKKPTTQLPPITEDSVTSRMRNCEGMEICVKKVACALLKFQRTNAKAKQEEHEDEASSSARKSDRSFHRVCRE